MVKIFPKEIRMQKIGLRWLSIAIFSAWSLGASARDVVLIISFLDDVFPTELLDEEQELYKQAFRQYLYF
jgi:hypothetical protein